MDKSMLKERMRKRAEIVDAVEATKRAEIHNAKLADYKTANLLEHTKHAVARRKAEAKALHDAALYRYLLEHPKETENLIISELALEDKRERMKKDLAGVPDAEAPIDRGRRMYRPAAARYSPAAVRGTNTVADLKSLLKAKGIKFPGNARKADLEALVAEAMEAKSPVGVGVRVAEIE